MLSARELQADEQWMNRALALARESVGLASPNPAVGCVLVRETAGEGQAVGEGFHAYDSRDHAEIVALKQAGAAARGATAYVTLEPCSHCGRTGPCAEALIDAGVNRVVAATLDPNPQVAGSGIARLRAAGIETTVGVCQTEARAINDAFAKFIQTGQPFVTLKAALSLDGKIAPAPGNRIFGTPHWLTGELAIAEVQRLRHASDAILTGIGTVVADNPSLTDRTGLSRRRPLLRIVLDAQLRLPLDSLLVQSAAGDVLVFCGESAPMAKQSMLEACGVQVERVQTGQDGEGVNLQQVLARVAGMDRMSILVEGGSRVNGAFLREGLVDKLVLFYAPLELGEEAVPFATGVASPYLLHQELRQMQEEMFGADACVGGLLRDPWEMKAEGISKGLG